MRRTLIIQALGCGGAERVLSWLANSWQTQGDEVTVVTLDGGRVVPFFRLHPDVQLCPLNASGDSQGVTEALIRNLARVIKLRRGIRRTRPDIVVSFVDTTNVLVLLATIGWRLPVIVSERCDPRLVPLPPVWRRLRALTYPRAAAVVTQTARTASWFSRRIRRPAEIIPNPVSRPSHAASSLPARATSRPDDLILLGVGRLEPQKGFDLLLRAFAKVGGDRPVWRVRIAGEGSQRESLARLAAELGIAGRVTFIGATHDITAAYAAADLFVMASRFEGFPNALVEAMAAGLPVIATDCPTGPREILSHGQDGLLVPPEDVEALAAAMATLMDDEPRRRAMGARSSEIVSRFSEKAIMAQWNNLIERALSTGPA